MFELHCLNCPSCIQALLQTHDQFVQEQERLENEFLLAKTLRLLDTLEIKSSNIMEVVFNAAREALRVITTTGESLSTGVLLPARGGENTTPADGQHIKIIQDFPASAVSVQVSFDRGETEDKVGLRISLLDTKAEDFLSGIEVTCTGPDGIQKAVTDKNGEAFFTLRCPAEYEARLEPSENQLIMLRLVAVSG